VYPLGILDGDLDAQWVAELGGVQRVLFAPAVTGTAIDVVSAYRLFHAVKRLTAAMVSSGGSPRLFIVTRNAQPVLDGDRANPVHAVLWGLGRSVALEHPEIWGAIIDLDESVPAVLTARWVLAEADAHDCEDQVVYRAGIRHVPRLQRHTPQSPAAGAVLDPDRNSESDATGITSGTRSGTASIVSAGNTSASPRAALRPKFWRCCDSGLMSSQPNLTICSNYEWRTRTMCRTTRSSTINGGWPKLEPRTPGPLAPAPPTSLSPSSTLAFATRMKISLPTCGATLGKSPAIPSTTTATATLTTSLASTR